MKRTIKYKRIFSLIAVLIIAISLFSVQADAAYSVSGQRIKAGIASAITALNVVLNSTLAPVQEMIDYIGDPFDVNYTWAEAWNDRPQIQIWNDYIEIDGEQYTDIWISNEAAEKFRVNAFDFITAKNITSNDSGILASGTGYYDGLPVYDVNGVKQTQSMVITGAGTYDFGDTGQILIDSGTTSFRPQHSGSWERVGTYYSPYNVFPATEQYKLTNRWYFTDTRPGTTERMTGISAGKYITSAFDFNWVSQDIPADQPLPDDTGMMIRIPSYDPDGNRYLEPFLVDNPEFDHGEPVTVDVTLDPDIMTKLDDLFDIIAPIIPIINNNYGDINFIENHETPVPVPDVPIVDATVPQVVQPIINEISNYGDQITQQIPQIIETIPTIDSICENIDTAPYHDLDTGLDHLPSFFLPFITDLRSALGIWHYVTEWLSQISTTFAFISGCLVGTTIMTPIYAAIAGFMCIKIYRRMTA